MCHNRHCGRSVHKHAADAVALMHTFKGLHFEKLVFSLSFIFNLPLSILQFAFSCEYSALEFNRFQLHFHTVKFSFLAPFGYWFSVLFSTEESKCVSSQFRLDFPCWKTRTNANASISASVPLHFSVRLSFFWSFHSEHAHQIFSCLFLLIDTFMQEAEYGTFIPAHSSTVRHAVRVVNVDL